jgi:hypothetical protein
VLDAKNQVLGFAVTGADSFANVGKTENHGVIPITALALLMPAPPPVAAKKSA